MAKTALDRAERLFDAGNYAELVELLEPQVPVYRESPRFYFLLGAACLRMGDTGGALTYLKRSEQLAPLDTGTMCALAALYLRRGEVEKAIDFYLRVLETQPRNRMAKAGLAAIRKASGPEELEAFAVSNGMNRLFPGGTRWKLLVLPTAAGLVLLAAAAFLVPMVSDFAHGLAQSHAPRPEVAAVSLAKSDRETPVVTFGSFRYVLTDKETLASFDKAKEFFQQYRDNAALIEINRLLNSNASPGIKAKAKALSAFVGKPDFRTAKDIPSFSEVVSAPWLYDGCTVVWKGMAANVRSEGQTVLFDFLVGYQDKKILEGLAHASIAGSEVPMDRGLEALAVLHANGSDISLECQAIHQLLGNS